MQLSLACTDINWTLYLQRKAYLGLFDLGEFEQHLKGK